MFVTPAEAISYSPTAATWIANHKPLHLFGQERRELVGIFWDTVQSPGIDRLNINLGITQSIEFESMPAQHFHSYRRKRPVTHEL